MAQAMANIGDPARYTALRGEIMHLTECSTHRAVAISEACREGWILQADGQYRLPL